MFKSIALLVLFVTPVLFYLPRPATMPTTMPNDSPNVQAEEQAEWERRVAPLKAAGVDLDSTEELIKSLGSDNLGVRLAAVYLLKKKHAAAAVPELRNMLADPSAVPLVSLEVCGALAELEANGATWKEPCRGLVTGPYDSMTRIRAAGLFAKHGDSLGWPLVKEGLSSGQPSEVQEAALVAHLFDGLPSEADGGRGQINVTKVSAEAFRSASETSQIILLGVIGKSAKPRDAEVVAGLAAAAKSQYARDSVAAIKKKLAQ